MKQRSDYRLGGGGHTNDIIPLRDLSFEDPFIECFGGEICFGVETCVVETGSDFRGVIIECVCDRKNNHLSRRNPKRPEVRVLSQEHTEKIG